MSSDQSLHDTAIDFTPVSPPQPWRAHEAAGWAAAVGLVTGGVWLAAMLAWRLSPDPTPLDALRRADRLTATATLAGLGAVCGLVAGGLVGLGRYRLRFDVPTVIRGISLGLAAGVGGGLMPFAAAATHLPAEVGTALVWVVIGAVVGGVGYSWSRIDTEPNVPDREADGDPWRLSGALEWTGATAAAAGGIWYAVLMGVRWLAGPTSFDAFAGREWWAVVTCAAIGGLYGLLVGGVAGFACGRPARARSGFAWGLGLGGLSALGAGLLPLAVTWLEPVPPEAGTTLVWAAIGAVVGLAGYTHSRLSVREPDDRPTWHPAGVFGWGLTIGGMAGVAWFGELALLRLLPARVELGPLIRGHEVWLAGVLALAGGLIGLGAGGITGLLRARSLGATGGTVRAVGFAGVGAAGGGLFPLVAWATADRLSAEASSALTWGVVCGVAAVIAYTWTRWPQPGRSPAFEADDRPASDRETVVVRTGVRLGAGPARPTEVVRLPAEPPRAAADEPDPLATPGWDLGPVPSTRTAAPPASPRVEPAARTTASGAIVRVAPVLLVTVVCLLAVGLSAPSPAGWPMLGVGLLGLAVSWALVGQERRIRELENRLRRDR